jgi:hypothetical protein
LMAKTETEWWSNFINCWSTEIQPNTDYASTWLNTCVTFTGTTDSCDATTCTYQKWQWQLRYIYVY